MTLVTNLLKFCFQFYAMVDTRMSTKKKKSHTNESPNLRHPNGNLLLNLMWLKEHHFNLSYYL